MVRLVLTDDHARFRDDLARVLSRQPGIEVAGQSEDTASALQAVRACPEDGVPLVLLVDVDLPGGGGMAVARAALAARPSLHVLALSMHDDPVFVAAMTAAGALGYALKGDPLHELLQAIDAVAAGRRYRSPGLG